MSNNNQNSSPKSQISNEDDEQFDYVQVNEIGRSIPNKSPSAKNFALSLSFFTDLELQQNTQKPIFPQQLESNSRDSGDRSINSIGHSTGPGGISNFASPTSRTTGPKDAAFLKLMKNKNLSSNMQPNNSSSSTLTSPTNSSFSRPKLTHEVSSNYEISYKPKEKQSTPASNNIGQNNAPAYLSQNALQNAPQTNSVSQIEVQDQPLHNKQQQHPQSQAFNQQYQQQQHTPPSRSDSHKYRQLPPVPTVSRIAVDTSSSPTQNAYANPNDSINSNYSNNNINSNNNSYLDSFNNSNSLNGNASNNRNISPNFKPKASYIDYTNQNNNNNNSIYNTTPNSNNHTPSNSYNNTSSNFNNTSSNAVQVERSNSFVGRQLPPIPTPITTTPTITTPPKPNNQPTVALQQKSISSINKSDLTYSNNNSSNSINNSINNNNNINSNNNTSIYNPHDSSSRKLQPIKEIITKLPYNDGTGTSELNEKRVLTPPKSTQKEKVVRDSKERDTVYGGIPMSPARGEARRISKDKNKNMKQSKFDIFSEYDIVERGEHKSFYEKEDEDLDNDGNQTLEEKARENEQEMKEHNKSFMFRTLSTLGLSTNIVDKTLHSLERHSTTLTGLGTDVKLNASKVFSDKYDYVIVFPYENQVQSPDAKYVIHTMIQAGLEVFPYLSIQEDELIVLFRAPLHVLKSVAEKSNFKLLCDPKVLEETLIRGNPEHRIAPVRIRHDPSITPISPFEHIYLQFQNENDLNLYHHDKGHKHPFSRNIRLKLLHFLITAPKRFGGCDMNLNSLILQKTVLNMFPQHDINKCNELLEVCSAVHVMPWDLPMTELKNYFGEKIAMYNVFMGHYSYWLLVPSAVGLVFQIVVWVTLDFSHPVLPFFAVLMTTWAMFMLEFWKREEHRVAMRWGMIDFHEREADRPEFHGKLHSYSHIDGKEMIYFPPKEFKNRIVLSLSIITTFICIVLGVIASIYILRFSLQPVIGVYSSLVSSILNVMQITSFNLLYQAIAVRLNDQENHRTDSQYEDSLIGKVFTFQFINSYASCFFLAFIAAYLPNQSGDSNNGNAGECGYANCMRPLSLNVGVIFFSRIVFKNLLDLFVPYIKCIMKIRKETSGIDKKRELTPAELDYMLMEYNSTLESIRNYADSAVQYGFMLLFVTALPITPLLGLVNNYIKIKTNSWKILTLYQRPIPIGTENIKSWQGIFNIISVTAVATNAGLVCFTMDVLNSYSLIARIWIFIGFQWMLMSVQYISSILIDDLPDEVHIQKQRIDCIHEKIVDKYEDDDYDESLYYKDSSDDEEKLTTDKNNNGSVFKGLSMLGRGKSTTNKSHFSVADSFAEKKDLLQIKDASATANNQKSNKQDTNNNDNGIIHGDIDSPSRPTFKRHDTKISNNSNSNNNLSSDNPSCCCSLLRSELFSSHHEIQQRHKGQHKRSYGESLPLVPVLEYPTSELDKMFWPRPLDQSTLGQSMNFDILKLDF